MFEGITTSELISYKIAGDNSIELKLELVRRGKLEITNRKHNKSVSMLELDAKFNGFKN